MIRSIYDAALNPDEWPAMLTRVARVMRCEQCNFVMVDPSCGDTRVITPMWREDDRASFFSHWQKEFTIAHKLRSYSVGQVIGYDELFDVSWLQKTAFYNEWWLPQGVGGGSLAANVVADSGATASITVHAPTTKLGFERAEKERFSEIVGHLARSVTILRRLKMAQLVTCKTEGGLASGFLVVDRNGLVLHSDAETLSWLEALDLVQKQTRTVKIAQGKVKALLLQAIEKAHGASLDLLDRNGARFRLMVIPCSPGEHLNPVIIDRPAALIWLISTEQLKKERMKRLSDAFSLTPAEVKIAIEACAGGGRAEIAERCGLSPSTIRSHLESIYSKTGVHRQSELVHLVETI
ncbi:hypothetical protein GRI38_10445 [Altererythrobacter aurantiacus]|uniref:HTH luxR-type domain-containing protein n=1 Tax=Parapontixanthobacter aurantiacus TaxID=1463599 RepID=A0A844ZGE8_9SPHN|nr:helix-turn-helix transcriptional regulator [Parapontixanthobacter aurantiacus]MXO86443.1 hypothetical protein [Parapontixanthobacter aurantiacus]